MFHFQKYYIYRALPYQHPILGDCTSE